MDNRKAIHDRVYTSVLGTLMQWRFQGKILEQIPADLLMDDIQLVSLADKAATAVLENLPTP